MIVEGIIRLISRDPMADRDTYHQGKKPNPPDEDESDRHPFRRFFVEERDSVIARNAFNIFEAASEVWPVAWQEIRPGHVLNRTTGVHSLLRFMGTSYRQLGKGKGAISKDRYIKLFESLGVDDDHFSTENYPTGGQGRGRLNKLFESSLER